MPELPEVEVVRRGLEAHAVGRSITSVEVLHPRSVRRQPDGPQGFVAAVTGRRIESAQRRGKYLWLPLDSGDAILGHLGMSGQILVQPPRAPDERHLRVRFMLSRPTPAEAARPLADHPSARSSLRGASPLHDLRDTLLPPVPSAAQAAPVELRFVDQRMFGGLAVSPGGAELPPEIAHIARDLLDPGFDLDAFVRRVRRRTSGIKRLLLDQTLVSGVGNIYADEALWRAGIHGERPGNRLTARQVRELAAHAHDVMTLALGEGGTSFDALYVDVNGDSGYFERSLNAYGRADQPCRRCGTPIRRVAFMNRSSFFCPVCQRPPRRRA